MVYLVSGYMRSGTSMLMACLEAGGMEVVRSPQRDRFNDANSDSLYRPNPAGLYEPTMKDMRNPAWWRQQDGKAVKCVAPWLQWLPVHHYQAVFMHRNTEEIRQSYEAAFGERLESERIEVGICEGWKSLDNRRDVTELTPLSFRGTVDNPLGTFKALEALGWPIDPAKAAAAVRPELCRFKRELLTEGL